MASRIPALPRDSHVQSHAAVHKNILCDPTLPSWRERSQVAGLDPELPIASVCYGGCQLRSAKCRSVTVRSIYES
jgi:hypothetical protein